MRQGSRQRAASGGASAMLRLGQRCRPQTQRAAGQCGRVHTTHAYYCWELDYMPGAETRASAWCAPPLQAPAQCPVHNRSGPTFVPRRHTLCRFTVRGRTWLRKKKRPGQNHASWQWPHGRLPPRPLHTSHFICLSQRSSTVIRHCRGRPCCPVRVAYDHSSTCADTQPMCAAQHSRLPCHTARSQSAACLARHRRCARLCRATRPPPVGPDVLRPRAGRTPSASLAAPGAPARAGARACVPPRAAPPAQRAAAACTGL